MITRLRIVMSEMLYLIRKYRFYIIAPTLILLALVGFFVYQVGPVIVVSFLYAGV